VPTYRNRRLGCPRRSTKPRSPRQPGAEGAEKGRAVSHDTFN
jgi:hypothetical protein